MNYNPLLASVDELLRGRPTLRTRFLNWLFPPQRRSLSHPR